MSVPGATTSGLMRWSFVGPRLLNAAMQLGSPEIVSLEMGGEGKALGKPPAQVICAMGPSGRSLRLAPTVIAFLLEAGEQMESQSTNPASDFLGWKLEPALPAAITISMSLRLLANSSTSSLSMV